MRFHIHQPSKKLLPYIQAYLEADATDSKISGENMLFPNGHSGIFFNFGNTGKLILNEKFVVKPVSVYGQIDHHFKAIHYPGFYSLGILFKPTVLSRFLRIDMAELTNKAYDGTCFRNDLKLLHERLGEFTSIKKKIELLEEYFTSALLKLHQHQTLTDHALSIIQYEESISMHKIAKDLSVSQRYLEKKFRTTVGVSPKTYSLIVRFMRMEQQLKTISVARWHQMNFANEYHDQNHFIKDFKRFTGHTPSAYLLNNFEMGRSYLIR